MAARLSIPYQLLTILLYGDMDWIEREWPQVVIPVGTISRHMKVRPFQVQAALEWLFHGDIISYEWYSNYAVIKATAPKGLIISQERSYDAQ